MHDGPRSGHPDRIADVQAGEVNSASCSSSTSTYCFELISAMKVKTGYPAYNTAVLGSLHRPEAQREGDLQLAVRCLAVESRILAIKLAFMAR